jgi:hypothetical protein
VHALLPSVMFPFKVQLLPTATTKDDMKKRIPATPYANKVVLVVEMAIVHSHGSHDSLERSTIVQIRVRLSSDPVLQACLRHVKQ